MLDIRSEFIGKVKEVNPDVISLHCMIHRYALASRTLPPELRDVLNDVIKMVNAIKSSSLNSHLFHLLCQDFEVEHGEVLLFHTEVRWLSRGNITSRVQNLREEMSEFFSRDVKAQSKYFSGKLTQKQWQLKLAYFSDIFSRQNDLNLSLQGKSTTLIDFINKCKSFT